MSDLKAQLVEAASSVLPSHSFDRSVAEEIADRQWPLIAAALGDARQQPAYDELMALYDAYWNDIAHYDEPTLDHKWMVIERDDVNRLDQLASNVEDALTAARGVPVEAEQETK